MNVNLVVDPSKTALENMFDLISATAEQTVSTSDIVLGTPRPWKSIYALGRNTTVVARKVEGSNYSGPLQFYYRRENLSKFDGVIQRGLPQDVPITEQFLYGILSDFGIIAEECVFGTVTPNLNEAGKYVVTVSARPTSYTYQGNTTLTITPDSSMLAARVLESGGLRLLEDGSFRLLE